MTALEIVKLCAEAMGYTILGASSNYGVLIRHTHAEIFNPLTNNAQAFDLLKKHCVIVHTYTSGKHRGKWRATVLATTISTEATGTDLNRVICEAVAKMQKKKDAKC